MTDPKTARAVHGGALALNAAITAPTVQARLPSDRAPTHPGEVLAEEFMRPHGLTQTELARRIGVPLQRVNLIVNGKRGVTPDTALRLARLFDTSPDLWLNLQRAWDLHAARQAMPGAELRKPSPTLERLWRNHSDAVDRYSEEPDDRTARAHWKHSRALFAYILDLEERLSVADREVVK